MTGTQSNTQHEGEEEVLTPEQIQANAEEDAAFEAAFNTANGDEPGTKESTSSSTTEAPAADTPAADNQGATLETDPATGTQLVKPGAAASDDDAPVTITRRQLNELNGVRDLVTGLQQELRRTVDSTNGRIGSLQQTLKEVKEQASQGIRPSFEQMEALEEEFPELASTLKRDLTRIFGKGNETQPQANDEASGAAAPGAASANPLEAPEVRKILRDKELAIVDARHEGWRDLPATTEWHAWANSLPPTAQELLRTTRDAATLSEALDHFKEWKKAEDEKRAASASASSQRGKRLEHAIPATTGSSTGHVSIPNEDELFEAGFKAQARR